MKLVVDTNTLISGSLWQGAPSRLLEAIEAGKVRIVLSPELLAEFGLVLSRPKFRERLDRAGTTPEVLMRKLARELTVIAPADLPVPRELRDPKDLPVLACAVAAGPDAIVSGDEDLLVMESFRGIPIITAREALRRLGLAE